MYLNYRAYLDNYPDVEGIPKVGYVPYKKRTPKGSDMPTLVPDTSKNLSTRREKKAYEARVHIIEENHLIRQDKAKP